MSKIHMHPAQNLPRAEQARARADVEKAELAKPIAKALMGSVTAKINEAIEEGTTHVWLRLPIAAALGVQPEQVNKGPFAVAVKQVEAELAKDGYKVSGIEVENEARTLLMAIDW